MNQSTATNTSFCLDPSSGTILNGSICDHLMQTTNHTMLPGNQFIPVWWVQLIYIVVFVAMIVVAAGGNVIVIWIVLWNKRMRTVTNYFLVNLAFADTLIVIFNVTFNFTYMLYSDWPFGPEYCKFSTFIAPTTISASVFTLIAISIDRYMAIVHPMRPRMSASTSRMIMLCIWITALIISSPNIIYSRIFTWDYLNGDSRTVCYLEWPDGAFSKTDFIYSLFLMIATYFFPILVLAITYTRVGIELWGSKLIGENTDRQMENVRSKRRVVKMMIMVVVIFAVCWLPQHVYFLLVKDYQYINDYEYIQHVYLFIYWLAMSNSMYNPIIYCWMNSRFRRGFKFVFRWCPFVRWDSGEKYLTNITTNTIVSESAAMGNAGGAGVSRGQGVVVHGGPAGQMNMSIAKRNNGMLKQQRVEYDLVHGSNGRHNITTTTFEQQHSDGVDELDGYGDGLLATSSV